MISLDTELMRELVNGCAAANDSIEDAVAALHGITSHDDWGCREKDKINEYTNSNKQKIQALEEASGNFLRVLRQVTHDFEEAENSIADMSSDVDAAIGGVVSIPTPIMRDIKPATPIGEWFASYRSGAISFQDGWSPFQHAAATGVLESASETVKGALSSTSGPLGSFLDKGIGEMIMTVDPGICKGG